MAKCKNCGASISWKKSGGEWVCHNAGTSVDHWDLCSERKFSKIEATGEYFEGENEKGYVTNLKPSGVQFTYQSRRAAGKNFVLSGKCRQCCPPWEFCADCPDKLPRGASGHG